MTRFVPDITDVLLAARFLDGKIRKTPCEMSPALEQRTGRQVALKWENQQICASFKVRGALNKMFSLTEKEKEAGVITASSGNHAQGVAMAASMLGVRAVICVPGTCPETKRNAIRARGGEWVDLKVIGHFYDEAELEAKRLCSEKRMTYVSAFEDLHVAAGQGTLGLEFIMDMPDITTLLVPISGAGLITGVMVAARALRPDIAVWGVYAKANPSWPRAWSLGKVVPVEEEETLADALSGAASSELFGFVRENLNGLIEITEEEMAEAILFLHREHHQVVEGAGAIGVAALLSGKAPEAEGKTGVVISGGNIDEKKLLELLRNNS